jgi:catechol 2,3-dioxygenase-like lactoylglutathione lyase family enzyme
MGTAGIHHVGLAVADLDTTTRFFTDGLGWKLVREVPDYPAKFVTDGVAFLTLWQTDPGAAPFDRKTRVGMHHLALKVADERQLNDLFEKVRAYPGVRVEFAPQAMGAGPARHCMFCEPGGIRMELAWTP